MRFGTIRTAIVDRRGAAPASLAAVLAVALLTGVLLSGCGAKDENQRPVVVLISDVSGSTKKLRKEGIFASGIDATISQTAAAEGQLWATRAEAAVLANSSWLIDGTGDADFKKPEGGETFQQQVLQAQADTLKTSSASKSISESTGNPGSDLMGALQLAATIFKNYPDRPRDLVLLTDGGINARGIEWTKNVPASPAAQDAIVAKLKASGEFPAGGLTGGSGQPVNVWIGGLGRGLKGNGGRDAQSIRTLWEKLIAAEGGHLVQGDSSLNLINFPQG